MLVIRLKRIGKKNKPYYRLIISEKSKDTFADFLEDLGSYNPHTDPPAIDLKAERIKYWLSQGAQPSNTVHNILVNADLVDAPKKRAVAPKKKKKGKGGGEEKVADEPKKEEKPEEKQESKKPKEEAKTEDTKPKSKDKENPSDEKK